MFISPNISPSGANKIIDGSRREAGGHIEED
jgi:hypothetical protein